MTNTQMTKHGFDLEERTLTFAKRVVRLCRKLPNDPVNRELIGQLIRAGGSVGANYREANDADSKKDFGHRIRITRREAKEVHFWLQLLEEANPAFDGQEIHALLQEALEFKKIFSSIAEKAG